MHTLVDTSQVFKYHLFLLKIIGLSPSDKDETWYWLFKISEWFHKLTFYSLMASFCIMCAKSENVEELYERFFMTSLYIKCAVNALFMQYKRLEFYKLSKIFKKLDVHVTAPEEVLVLESTVKNVHICFVLYYSLYYFILLYFEVMTSMLSEPTLTFSFWLPWEWKQGGIRFTLAHIFLLYGLISTISFEVVGDTFPQASLCTLSGHLRALALRMGRIKIRASHEQDLACLELVACIKDHNLILEAFGIVHGILSVPATIQFGNSASSQCSLAMYVVYMGFNSGVSFFLFLIFVASIIMTFVLCVYGEFLQNENERFTRAVYACNWPDQNNKFRKYILQLLRQSQCNLQIKAANVFPLNLETFLSVYLKIIHAINE